MKPIMPVLLIISICFFAGCRDANTSVAPDSHVFVQGNWQGTLDGTNLVITFIEGEFERGHTLTGSASLATEGAYSIMNGTSNNVGAVSFALYKVPVSGIETYDLKGTVGDGYIVGTFTKLNQDGNKVGTGNWQAQRIP